MKQLDGSDSPPDIPWQPAHCLMWVDHPARATEWQPASAKSGWDSSSCSSVWTPECPHRWLVCPYVPPERGLNLSCHYISVITAMIITKVQRCTMHPGNDGLYKNKITGNDSLHPYNWLTERASSYLSFMAEPIITSHTLTYTEHRAISSAQV